MFLIFPGQGSQKAQMGLKYASNATVNKYIDIATEVTKKDVRYLLNEASQEQLDLTENAQIALFSLNYALAKIWEEKNQQKEMPHEVTMVAGHSLGEYVALTFAQVLSFEDACLLIAQRSKLMSQVKGKMLAVLGVDFATANMIASLASNAQSVEMNIGCEGAIADCCFVANHNSGSQFVLSGSESAILRAQAVAQKLGKKSVVLATSGPFHSPYMFNACKELLPMLDKLTFNEERFPIVSNIFARADVDFDADNKISWQESVAMHMKAPVRWFEGIQFHENYINLMASELDMSPEMKSEHSAILEIGAVSVLANMTKRDGYNIEYYNDYL